MIPEVIGVFILCATVHSETDSYIEVDVNKYPSTDSNSNYNSNFPLASGISIVRWVTSVAMKKESDDELEYLTDNPLTREFSKDGAITRQAKIRKREVADYHRQPHNYEITRGTQNVDADDSKKRSKPSAKDSIKEKFLIIEPDGSTRVIKYMGDDQDRFNEIIERTDTTKSDESDSEKPFVPILAEYLGLEESLL